ncbi:MAG: ATP-binding protein [Candidatus Dormibacteraceae bacterium]
MPSPPAGRTGPQADRRPLTTRAGDGAKRRAWLSWSSGKDSAWALYRALQDPHLEVRGLLTTITRDFDRVSMHAVRRSLVERQAARLGVPLHVVELPWPCPNEVYEASTRSALAGAADQGVDVLLFGDLFLADVRAYRERLLAGTGVEPRFPLWGEDTRALTEEMLAGGLRARITCVDPRVLDPSFAGRPWDGSFLAALPRGVDPCGEHGEFHTFVVDSPDFTAPVGTSPGRRVLRDGFWFADLIPD